MKLLEEQRALSEPSVAHLSESRLIAGFEFDGNDATGYSMQFRLQDDSGRRISGPLGDFAFLNPVLVGGARRGSFTLVWAEPAEAGRGQSMDERRSLPPESLWSADYNQGVGWSEPVRILVGRLRWAREFSDLAADDDSVAFVVPLEDLPGIATIKRTAGGVWTVHKVQTSYLPRAASLTFADDGLKIAAAMLENPAQVEARYQVFVVDFSELQHVTRWRETTPVFRTESQVRMLKLRSTSYGDLTATIASDAGSVEHWIRRRGESAYQLQYSSKGDRRILRLTAEAVGQGGVWVAYLREPISGLPRLETFQARGTPKPCIRAAPSVNGVVDVTMSSRSRGVRVTLVGLLLREDELGRERARMLLAEPLGECP